MSIKIENIGGATSEVSGGFSHTEVYVALLENFTALTEPKERDGASPAASLAELVTIDTPHTFETGFGFTKIKAIRESVGLETTQIGDVTKSPMQENKLTLQMLGSEAEILGFKRWAKGRDLVVLATEFESGNLRQIGSAKFGGKLIESSSKIEAALEGENTTTLVFQDKQKYDAPIYSGTIEIQPAA
ncbi:hypothetical protein [Tenacibaculum mesophilum]|uniref:hypothetical protein n=1 Tax=Tenacibaculum mesophilum TaxID=104268 RepID=UPI00249021C0|nr:hypothetical protein [Tenacibaculum mesophilum]